MACSLLSPPGFLTRIQFPMQTIAQIVHLLSGFDTSSCRIRISFASRPRRTRLCPSSAEEQSRQSRKQVRLWQSSSASAGWPRAGYRQLTAEISAATNVNIATAHGTCVTYGLLLWSLLDLQSRLELWRLQGPLNLTETKLLDSGEDIDRGKRSSRVLQVPHYRRQPCVRFLCCTK